jgi:hypothetical protein
MNNVAWQLTSSPRESRVRVMCELITDAENDLDDSHHNQWSKQRLWDTKVQ